MRCPYCKANHDRVIDSRTSGEADAIRRRRECLECGGRFTTYEKVGETPLRVVKKDGTRVAFDRDAIVRGMLMACHKRPVSTEALDAVVGDIESQLHEMFDKEVSSKYIGHLVMEALRELDQVAYVRFASVYREFKDVNQFLDELKPLLGALPDERAPAVGKAASDGPRGRALAGLAEELGTALPPNPRPARAAPSPVAPAVAAEEPGRAAEPDPEPDR